MAVCDIIEIYEVYQRQKDLRIDVNLNVEFKTEKGWYFLGKIQNISAGGIFLVTSQVLKRNEHFSFRHYLWAYLRMQRRQLGSLFLWSR